MSTPPAEHTADQLTEPYPGKALRVFGPPGTGKTTYLAARVQSTVATYGVDAVALMSFSRTAAEELASRFAGFAGPRPPASAIGTMHSQAYRSIGAPPVALDPKIIEDWNSQALPDHRITPDTRRSGGDSAGAFAGDAQDAVGGDELLAAYDKLRAALTPLDDYPPHVREFVSQWEAWKRSIGAVDYTDMISSAFDRARQGGGAPGTPRFLIVDEAQDMTPLEVALAREWGKRTENLIFGMDDDQAINRWRGGDPEPLLNLRGEAVTDHVLGKSFRVPEAVRAAAEQWVKRLSLRREKLYAPRTRTERRIGENGAPYEHDTGETVLGVATVSTLRLSSAKLVEAAVQHTDAGRSVMIIAACNYMLTPLLRNLREAGVPFHNPFRPGEMAWNPLGAPAVEGQMSTVERIRRYLAVSERDWTGEDVRAWLELIKLSEAGMKRGSKAAAQLFDGKLPVDFKDIAAMFADPAALTLATEPSLDWLSRSLLATKKDVAAYPIHLARTHGPTVLDVVPGIVVGTVHSVKGAGADVVYLNPDVSPAAGRAMTTRGGVDETIRQFYVGMTRTKEQLHVLAPATANCVRTDELVPPHLEVL